MTLGDLRDEVLGAVRDGRARGRLAEGTQRLPPMTDSEEIELWKLLEQVRDRLVEDIANADKSKRIARIRRELLWLKDEMPEAEGVLPVFDVAVAMDITFLHKRFSTKDFIVRLAPVYQQYAGAEIAFSKEAAAVTGPFVRFVCSIMKGCGVRAKPDGVAKAITKYKFKPKAETSEERFARTIRAVEAL